MRLIVNYRHRRLQRSPSPVSLKRHLSSSVVFLLLLAVVMNLSGVLKSTIVSGQYKWQDDKGNWHFSDNISKVPPSVREKMGKNLFAEYEKLENKGNIYKYRGFQPFSPGKGITVRRNDFVVVSHHVDQGVLELNRSYNQLSYLCLYLKDDGTVESFDLSALFFLANKCVVIAGDEKQKKEYVHWKKAKLDGYYPMDFADNSERNKKGENTVAEPEADTQEWRVLFYLSNFGFQ